MRKRNIEFLNQAKEKWSSDSIAERRDVVTNFVESVLGQFKVRVQKLYCNYTHPPPEGTAPEWTLG